LSISRGKIKEAGTAQMGNGLRPYLCVQQAEEATMTSTAAAAVTATLTLGSIISSSLADTLGSSSSSYPCQAQSSHHLQQ